MEYSVFYQTQWVSVLLGVMSLYNQENTVTGVLVEFVIHICDTYLFI